MKIFHHLFTSIKPIGVPANEFETTKGLLLPGQPKEKKRICVLSEPYSTPFVNAEKPQTTCSVFAEVTGPTPQTNYLESMVSFTHY